MKASMRLIIAAFAILIAGVAIGYIGCAKSRNVELERSLRSLAIVQSAKETVYYTRLLESLRDGKADFVTDRLETMLDHSIIDIGIQTEFAGPPPEFGEAVSTSLCVARNYRKLHPHRPSDNWAAKYYDAALALKTDAK
jgi:hypothetical protein